MAGRLPPTAWAAKAQTYLAEQGGMVLRVEKGDDDEEELSDASIDDVRNGVPGHYRLADKDGRRLVDCIIGQGGGRLRGNRSDSNTILAQTVARDRAANTDAWDRLSSYQAERIREQDKLIDQLRAENSDLKEQLVIAKAEKDEEGSEWVELAQTALEVWVGKASKQKIVDLAERLGPQLSEEARAELLPLLNRELQS